MPEAKRPMLLGRPHRVNVAADAKHLGPFLGGESVVNSDLDWTVAQEGQQPLKEPRTHLVGIPGTSRKEAMERLMVTFASHTSHHERFCDCMDAVGLNPTDSDDQEVGEPRASQRGTNRAQDFKETGQSIDGHVPMHARSRPWQASEAERTQPSYVSKQLTGRSSSSTGARPTTSNASLASSRTSPKTSLTSSVH